MAIYDLTLPELGSRLAFLTALEKVVKERKGDVRFETDRQLRNLSETTGVESLALKIGDYKVGKLTMTQPKPAVADQEQYAKWAFSTGAGHRRLVIDFDDSDRTDEEVLTGLAELVHHQFGGNYARFEYEADDIAKKDLQIVAGRVVSKTTGETVPGTYVKGGYTICTGIKPEEVGHAMSMTGYIETVAGFLEGEYDDEDDE